MSDFDKFIKILKLNEYYSAEELKKAYRKAVIENHPDKFQDAEAKKHATEQMKKINEAYEYLKDYIQTDYKNDTEDTYYTDNEDDENYEEETDDYESMDDSDEQTQFKNQYSSKNSNNKKKTKTNSFDDLIKILEYAINTQSQVKIKYINRMNQVSERVILPFEIIYGLYEKDKIYLIAYCLVKNKDLTFRLDRIINAQRVKDSGINNQTEEFTFNENIDVNLKEKTLIENPYIIIFLIIVFFFAILNWEEMGWILFIILLFIDWRLAFSLLLLILLFFLFHN